MSLRRLANTPLRVQVEIALLGGSAAVGCYVLGHSETESGASALTMYCLAAPILAGLMHGLQASIWVALMPLLTLRLVAPDLLHGLANPILGSGVVALMAGQLTDVRKRALAVATSRQRTQTEQLEQQYRTEQVLRATNARLTERCSAHDWSVEVSVEAAKGVGSGASVQQCSDALLALVEGQAMVRAAAVYLTGPSGQLRSAPASTCGPLKRPSIRHGAIQTAFSTGQLVAAPLQLDRGTSLDETVLLAVPLVASHGQILGVLAVHDLPFIAIHDAHFVFVATLVNAFADTFDNTIRNSNQTDGCGVRRGLSVVPEHGAPNQGFLPVRDYLARTTPIPPAAHGYAERESSGIQPTPIADETTGVNRLSPSSELETQPADRQSAPGA